MEKIDQPYEVIVKIHHFESLNRFMKVVNKFQLNEQKREMKLLLRTPIVKEWLRLGYNHEQIYEKLKSDYYLEQYATIGENIHQSRDPIHNIHNS